MPNNVSNVSFMGPQGLAAALSPDAAKESLALQQQQALAQGLMGDAMQPLNPAQQSGGWAIPISPTQGLTHVGKALAAALMQNNINDKQAELQQKQMKAFLGMFGPQPQQATQVASISPDGIPQQQPQQGGGFPLLPGRSPQQTALQMMMAPESYWSGVNEANKPKPLMNMRPGGTAYDPNINQPLFSAPAGGIQTQWGPQGPSQSLVPGAQGAMSSMAASQAGATEAGKAPYQLETLNTPGAPTLMTRQQAIEGATGQPMPVPGQPVQQPPQPLPVHPGVGRRPGMTLQDQGAGAEQRKFGEQLGEYTSTVMNDAAKAAVSNRYLDNMEMAAKDISLGKLAPAQSSLVQWAQAAGIPVSEDAKKEAGSVQALTSMAIKMAGQATRQADAQPSQLQYLKILESMPNAQRTQDGFNKITAYLRDANNYNVAKMQHLQQWRQTHNGTAEGFEAAWPKIANGLPFVWNQQRRASDLKAIANDGANNDPLGIRK